MKYYWKVTWHTGCEIKEYCSNSFVISSAISEASYRGANDSNIIKVERIAEVVS